MSRISLGTRKCICGTCAMEYQYDRSKRNGSTATRCGKCGVQKFRKAKKLKAVEYKGGKCSKCGYNKCIEALEFHHVDRNQKVFEIGNSTFSWEKTKAELDKCILVCANCHRELEAQHNIDKVNQRKQKLQLC